MVSICAAEVAGAVIGPDTLACAVAAGADPADALARNDAIRSSPRSTRRLWTGPDAYKCERLPRNPDRRLIPHAAPHRPDGPQGARRPRPDRSGHADPCRGLRRPCRAPPVSPMARTATTRASRSAYAYGFSVMFTTATPISPTRRTPTMSARAGMIVAACTGGSRGNIRRRSGGLIGHRPGLRSCCGKTGQARISWRTRISSSFADGARLELQSWLLAASLAQAHDGQGRACSSYAYVSPEWLPQIGTVKRNPSTARPASICAPWARRVP